MRQHFIISYRLKWFKLTKDASKLRNNREEPLARRSILHYPDTTETSTNSGSRPSLDAVPQEIILRILSYLENEYLSILTLRLCSRRFYRDIPNHALSQLRNAEQEIHDLYTARSVGNGMSIPKSLIGACRGCLRIRPASTFPDQSHTRCPWFCCINGNPRYFFQRRQI